MKYSIAVIGLLAILVSSAGTVRAQRFELGLSVGALKSGDHTLPTTGTIKADTGFAYEANFAARVYNAHLAALYVEVPFAGTPNTGLTSSIPTSPSDYSSFFFTPGLKLKLLPVAPISPYGFVGAGFARFHSGAIFIPGLRGSTST
jgi:hypothetical protein